MNCSNATRGTLFALLVFLSVTVLAAQNSKPITFKGLVDALKIHGLSNAEIAQIVKTQGVDFELSPDMESELKAVGADADLLAAVRASYRGTPSTERAQPPVSQPPPPQSPPSEPPHEKSPKGPVINSIRDVKKIYIQKMQNDLDEYIKSEISRQMPGRLLVVLHQEDADAVMKGTSTNRRGNVTITDLRGTAELWAGEASDDMSKFLPKVHGGGEKKVAERLVSNLKKAMQK
jgi:hypothetical protein